MIDLLFNAFPYTLTFTAPILICSIAALINTKGGVVNIGLDGIMIVGSFASALSMYFLYNGSSSSMLIISLIISGLAGCLFSLVFAVSVIEFKADHIIAGIAINMIALSLTLFLGRSITGKGIIRVDKWFQRIEGGFLGEIPILGDLFFTKYYKTTYLALLITIIVYYIFKYTRFGKNISSCGENPYAAESCGINVRLYKYVSILFSGFLAGLAGGIVILTYQREFTGSSQGIGFLALITIILGKHDVKKVLLASLFFGFVRTFASMASVNETLAQFKIPMEFYNMLPYILTLIGIALSKGGENVPKYLGEIYIKGKR